MTIEECYQTLGGNYAEVSTRLPGLCLIEKFIGKFLDDKSFETLCREMEAGNREEAFRAAHTLKGVCANLSFTRLLESVSLLTEELRLEAAAISDKAFLLQKDVQRDYQATVLAVRTYLDKE